MVRQNALKKKGFDADAFVSRIEERESAPDENGNTDTQTHYYVRYRTRDGQVIEAILAKVPKHTVLGDRFRIKYLPEKPKYVIPAE